jgi:hypothetical protein
MPERHAQKPQKLVSFKKNPGSMVNMFKRSALVRFFLVIGCFNSAMSAKTASTMTNYMK